MAYRRTYFLSRMPKVQELKELAMNLYDHVAEMPRMYPAFLEVIESLELNTEVKLPFPKKIEDCSEKVFSKILRAHPECTLAVIFAAAYTRLSENAVEVCPNIKYVMCRYSGCDDEMAEMELEVEMAMRNMQTKMDPYFHFSHLLRITLGG